VTGARFQATVKKDGKIRLEVEPEVSLLHRESGKRMIERILTTTELKPGQTFVLGGLCHSVAKKRVAAVPVLGALPLVGSLFQFDTIRDEEVELVFLVTPTVLPAAGQR
jgi:pilus assembly protein CpaC